MTVVTCCRPHPPQACTPAFFRSSSMNASFVQVQQPDTHCLHCVPSAKRSRDPEIWRGVGGGSKIQQHRYSVQQPRSIDPIEPPHTRGPDLITVLACLSDVLEGVSSRKWRRPQPNAGRATARPPTPTGHENHQPASCCPFCLCQSTFQAFRRPPPSFERHTCCSCLGLKRAPEGRQPRPWGDGLRVLLRMNVCARLRATRQKVQTTQRAGRIS